MQALLRVLSPQRLHTYLVAANRDPDRAIRLYLWNARVGEAFHIAIQAVEVALRNSVNLALIAEFGETWWATPGYVALLDHDRIEDLQTVRRRIANRQQAEDNGQIVAGLSFGFWVGMLQPRYNPGIWSKQLRAAFPHLPEDRSRKSLARMSGTIANLRNRISHHEPLLKRSLLEDYGAVMEVLGWLSPAKQRLIRPHCRVPEIVRQRP